MKTNRLYLYTSIILSCCWLAGCSHLPKGNGERAIAQALEQVNDAVSVASAQHPEAPELVSVQVDLQVSTQGGVNASFPLNIVVPQASSSQKELHRVSMTFAPKPNPAATQAKIKASPLANTIEEIYKTIVQATPNYTFKSGSIQIECTFEDAVGASVSQGSGSHSGGDNTVSQSQSFASGGTGSGSNNSSSAGNGSSSNMQLVPIQAGVSVSHESVQTVTLNFAPRVSAGSLR